MRFQAKRFQFNDLTLVAMIVPTRMCRVPHPLNCLTTPLVPIFKKKLDDKQVIYFIWP